MPSKSLPHTLAVFAFLLLDLSVAVAEIEEVLITARQREEIAREVPVTLTSIDQQTAELFQLSSVRDISELVPNLITTQRGSGAAAAIYLRGIGSNNNDAAFDSAVALNFDGVMANSSRLITNGNLDMVQIDILKGPQSLYFGKGASAGVISIRSADPTKQFEGHLNLSREFEEDGLSAETLISGALSEQLLARLALRSHSADEVTHNSDPNAANQRRGEDHKDGRLTLIWSPSDVLTANLKYSFSDYENDGPLLFADIQCREGQAQHTEYTPALIQLPNNYNCDFRDQTIQVADQNVIEAESQPGNNDGMPYGHQSLDIARLQLDWAISTDHKLTSITSLLDMNENGFDCYAYDSWGSNCITTENTEESFSQELRLHSNYTDQLAITAGIYFQDRELLHRNYQIAFGISYLTGADPVTGHTFDWIKEHTTDHRTLSAYANLTWNMDQHWALSLGGRFSDEEKDNIYSTPYVHDAISSGGKSASSGFSVATSFSDSNFSPEASLSYKTENTTYFIAYKTGFKSGGVAYSPLPVFDTYLNLAAGDTSELIFDSETSQGFEIGMKSLMADNSLQVNTTLYRYIYEDLQIQDFDPVSLAFVTLNADEVTNTGIESDFIYQPQIDGLSIFGSIAYTDTEYTDSFINIIGADLNGEKRQQAPEWTGNLGLNFNREITRGHLAGFNISATYTDDYLTNNSDTGGPNSFTQPEFWRGDLAFYLENAENGWELRLTAKNISDKIFTSETVGRPNSTPNGNGEIDLVHFHNRGRQLTLTATYNF